MTSSPPNKKFDGQTGFPTANAAPDTNGCRVFVIPADEEWFAQFMAAVDTLTDEWRYFNNGDLTATENVTVWEAIIDQAVNTSIEGQCSPDIGAPFWDDEGDVEGEDPVDMQTWYGEVTNPTAPPGDLDFVENVGLWIVTGFVAIATGSAGVALAFRTFVSNFILIQKIGDLGQTIRYVVDGQDMKTISEADYAPNTLVEIPIIADPSLETHQIYIVRTA